jgi:hypothetical protein
MRANERQEIRFMSTDSQIVGRTLGDAEVEQFIHDGFVRIDNAFSREIAEAARDILWRDTGCDSNERTSWTKPVIRLGDYSHEPFRMAANTPILHQAFDMLVGKGRWVPRESLGSFPIRFPHPDEPRDAGWHVDASFPPEREVDSYLEWRINQFSRGRALLMLFLFSDVDEADAPTRIRIGSHWPVARLLRRAGDEGMTTLELANAAAPATDGFPEAVAIGGAGTVYLCHPFLVHAAQSHRGRAPRFMAQPPLYPRVPIELTRADSDYSPVEQAIRLAIKPN